jgi:hypothetical protein
MSSRRHPPILTTYQDEDAMIRALSFVLTVAMLSPAGASADDAQIKSAESAGPASISNNATIKDWNMRVLRQGTNGWTCLPDRPRTPGTDPFCVNEPWLKFFDAMKNRKTPTYTEVGIAYMLQGDTPVSNTDPFATTRKPGDDWVEGLGAHVMMLIPDRTALKDVPTNSKGGGPWVMWPDTPYAHLMIPIDPYPPK